VDPLHLWLEDGEARSKLRVLRAATEEGAPKYLAILSVFVDARDRYQVEVSTQQVGEALVAQGVDIENLDAALNQLKEWGNLTWSQDTTRVARLEDFRRRQALWQLTATGHAAYEAVIAVIQADDQHGSLQRTLLRDIRDALTQLADAIEAADAEVVYLRLRDLDSALHDLAANARDFHASVAMLRREHDVDPERFLAYKHLLIDYLEQFLGHLSTQRDHVARLVRAVEELGVDRMVALAALGDDSGGLFDETDAQERWRLRWSGLASWFVGDGGTRSGADDLEAATTGAIRELLNLLRRVVESSRRPITRASELVHMARWFRRLESDDAASELFDVSFGLGRPLHLRGHPSDPEASAATESWRTSAPVPVPITLREHGRRPSPGRPAPAVDYRQAKAALAAEHAEQQDARARAAAQLTARPIEGRTLSDPEVGVLFELLDRAAHRRPVGEAPGDSGAAVIEGAAATLVPDHDGMVINTRRGTMTIEGHRLEVVRSEMGR
jgi:uncharacterized protein (TIGR02677 family)